MTETFEYLNRAVNILLIDDDEIDAKAITRAFKKARIGNPIYRAEDGIEALAMLRGEGGCNAIQDPFICLVDLNMPRMDGIEFVKELRRDEALKSSIVFILTTSKRDEDKVAAYDLNVAGYIVKEKAGIDFMHLIGMIDHYWRIVELP